MSVYPAPSPAYLGPAVHTSGEHNKPIHRIVVHCTVSPCVAGGARATAAYFRTEKAGGSAHYVVDPGEVVQAVYDSWIAWHAPPNPNSLGVELCDDLKNPAWDKANAHRWEDDDHSATLRRGARLVAELCLAYGVPAVRLTTADVKAGKRGICGHVDVSRAFGESSHWDPGAAFPWDRFMGLVQGEVKNLKGGSNHLTVPLPRRGGKTPNVTAALSATTDKARRRALVAVTRFGSAHAKLAAQRWIDALDAAEAAEAELAKSEGR